MYWPLMEETITLKDRLKMAAFVLTSSRLTYGPKVREVVEKWSEWLGVKHSLYVSSGSTCLLYTSPSPRDATLSRMPSSA